MDDSDLDSIKTELLQRIGGIGGDGTVGDADERDPKIFRQRRPNVDAFTGDRMLEAQPCRVQEMPLRRQSHQTASAAPPVSIVTHHRMPDTREVDAYLMRASGKQVRAKQIA